jgi:hypothetical protein
MKNQQNIIKKSNTGGHNRGRPVAMFVVNIRDSKLTDTSTRHIEGDSFENGWAGKSFVCC